MTKIRYRVNDAGELVDRDGNVLGRLTGLTLDVPAAEGRGGTLGGCGVLSPSNSDVDLDVDVQRNEEEEKEKSPRETASVADVATILGASAEAVWRYWCAQRKPRRTELSAEQAKLITKALRAGFTVPDLCLAIDGLLGSDWHRERKKLQISTIFATRPGGPTLTDQVEGWIEKAPASTAAGAVTSAEDVRSGHVNSLKADVLRAWWRDHARPEPTRDAQERAAAAIEGLRGYGIEVSFEDGKPVFT